MRRTALIVVAMSCTGLVLSGCSSTPSMTGVWSASDGSADKVIGDDGQCSGMYYSNGSVLDIGGGETCALGAKESAGTYPLVVLQQPNQETLDVAFDGDTVKFESGGKEIVLTKR